MEGALCKKVENGGCFVKKWTFPQRMVYYVVSVLQYTTVYYSISIFILHFTHLGGAYAPNAPPPRLRSDNVL